MEFWSELGGGAKAILVLGLLLAISLGAYNSCSTPTAEEERANDAKRSVR